jgi:sec-independent protein translocase protein TatC
MTSYDSDFLSDDFFQHTRMSFGDHIEELRRHLWRAILGFLAILALVFVFDFVGYLTDTRFGIGRPMMDFIIHPVEEALQNIYDQRRERVMERIDVDGSEIQELNKLTDAKIQIDIRAHALALARAQGQPDPQFPGFDDGPIYADVPIRFEPVVWAYKLAKANQLMGPRPTIKSFSLTEVMMVYFKVALACGVVLGSPWFFWQLWSFIAAGLYPNEKKYVHLYLPFSLGLFLAGVLLCEFMVIPRAIEALLWFNEWLNVEPNMRLDEWLGFAVMMPLVFGASFQVPLVMLFLERMGILSVADYRAKRRIAIFLMAIFAAVITPTPDVVNFSLLWIPMCFLYELGIWLCKFSGRKDAWEDKWWRCNNVATRGSCARRARILSGQAPNHKQMPNSKFHTIRRAVAFGDLAFVVCLRFGVWDFEFATSPC